MIYGLPLELAAGGHTSDRDPSHRDHHSVCVVLAVVRVVEADGLPYLGRQVDMVYQH